MATRAMTKRTPVEQGNTNLLSKTCISDAIRIWNQAPMNIKTSSSLYSLKKSIKDYVKTLPI